MSTLARMGQEVVTGRLRFNTRFVVRLAVAVAAVAAVGAGLYYYQAGKLVEAYKAQADRAKADGKPAEELDFLRRYLLSKPGDPEAQARVGVLMAQLARRPAERKEAYYALQAALRSDPTLPADVRLQAVKLAMHPAVFLPDDARRDLDILQKAEPGNAEYRALTADCLIYVKDYKAADAALVQVIAADKTRVAAYAKLAYIRRALVPNQTEEATKVVENLTFANKDTASAWVVAADHWRALARPDKLARAVATAQRLAPADPDVVFAVADLRMQAGEAARRKGDKPGRAAALAEVSGLFAKLVADQSPKLPPAGTAPDPDGPAEAAMSVVGRAYHGLVEVAQMAGDTAAAGDWADRHAKALPGSVIAKVDRADTLIARSKLDDADAVLADLTRLNVAPGLVDYLRGRVLMLRQQWPAAGRALEAAQLGLTAQPTLARKANLLLAQTYRETGELDRRLDAYRRATAADPLDPDWAQAVAGTADTLAQLGRPAEAADAYRKLAQYAPAAAAPLARLTIEEAARRPAGKRDWAAAERDLAKVPPGPDADLLAAELAVAKQDPTARAKLAALAAKTPAAARVWSLRVLLELADNQPGRAAELLKEAAGKVKDGAELRLLTLRVHMAGAKTPDGIQAVLAGADALPPADRRAVTLAAAGAAQAVGRRDLAKEWLTALAAARPDDLDVQMARFDVALLEKDQATADAVVAQVVATTGGADTVPSKVVKSFALLDRAKPGDPALAEAATLMAGLERQRPGWGRLYLAQGRVADLQADYPAAAAKYRQAVDLGERRPEVVGRLVELYAQLKEYAAANEVFQLVPAAAKNLGGKAGAEVALAAKNYALAADLADKQVPAASVDPADQLWLARVKIAAGRLADAEKPARRATELDPARPDGWVTLVSLLGLLNKPADAAAAVTAAEKHLNPATDPLPLATCYEAAGRPADAQKVYDRVTAPADAPPDRLRAAARFALARNDVARAKPLLERVLAAPTRTDTDRLYAERSLALLLSRERRPDSAQRALEVMKLQSVDDAVTRGIDAATADEVRTRAVVVAGLRGRKPRQAALQLLEILEKKTALTADDQLLFAQLHDALGDWAKARPRFETAAAAGGRTAVVAYAFALLRQKNPDAARTLVDKVTAAAPADPALAELRVRLAVAAGKPDDAAKLAADLAAATKRPELAGALLEQAGLPDRAEPHFRQAATTPGGKAGLALYLARRNRLADAWPILESVWSQLPAQATVPAACEAALQSGADAPDVVAKVRAKVAQTVADKPPLEIYLAALMSITGDYAGSAAATRRVLDREPQNVLALNNLAYLTALHENNPDGGLELIRRAVGIAGPVPTLLDTEGLILTRMPGRAPDAVEKLQESVIDEPSAMAYFHLAHAHHAAGQKLEAKAALASARQRNLRPADFHPLERPAVKGLEAAIGAK